MPLSRRFVQPGLVTLAVAALVSAWTGCDGGTSTNPPPPPCLRLIRPTRQVVEEMWGRIRDNGMFDVTGFTHPVTLDGTPYNQKLFTIRNQDADGLREYAPEFLRAMRGDFWKFRMATQFHNLGHWLQWQEKGRFSLWASAIEAIYTSNQPEHRGSLVATERIKWFLKEGTSIYPPGELSEFEADPNLTVGKILRDLYLVAIS